MVTIARPDVPRFSDAAEPRARREEVVVDAHLNVAPLFQLGGDTFLHFRGRAFRCPPLDFRLGARLIEIKANINELRMASQGRALSDEQRSLYMQLVGQVLEIARKAVRPCSRWQRALRMIGLWRPFRRASDREIGELLDFLLDLRASSSIRL